MSDMPGVRDLVVVGVDNTPAGSAALRWAVDESARRGCRAMAVHVYDRGRADLAHERDHVGAKAREQIEVHRQVVDVVGDRAARLGIAIAQLDGPVATMLVQAAQDAVLLVLGRPSDNAHEGLTEEVVRRCACPVVLVADDGAVESLVAPQ